MQVRRMAAHLDIRHKYHQYESLWWEDVKMSASSPPHSLSALSLSHWHSHSHFSLSTLTILLCRSVGSPGILLPSAY